MDKNKTIQELDRLTSKWVKKHNLFRGGCAYATAVLARELKKAGVEYEIVSYYQEKDFDPIEKKTACRHLAITVKDGRKKKYIGGEPNLIEGKKTRLGKVSPVVLMKYYENLKTLNQWNSTYCVKKNYVFSLMCHLTGKQEDGWARMFYKILNSIF